MKELLPIMQWAVPLAISAFVGLFSIYIAKTKANGSWVKSELDVMRETRLEHQKALEKCEGDRARHAEERDAWHTREIQLLIKIEDLRKAVR